MTWHLVLPPLRTAMLIVFAALVSAVSLAFPWLAMVLGTGGFVALALAQQGTMDDGP